MAEKQAVFATRIHARIPTGAIQIQIDGKTVTAYSGETVAAVLMLNGHRIFDQPSRFNLVRTVYCGMGLCHQCLVTIDGVRDLRACMSEVHPGMQITSQMPAERASE